MHTRANVNFRTTAHRLQVPHQRQISRLPNNQRHNISYFSSTMGMHKNEAVRPPVVGKVNVRSDLSQESFDIRGQLFRADDHVNSPQYSFHGFRRKKVVYERLHVEFYSTEFTNTFRKIIQIDDGNHILAVFG